MQANHLFTLENRFDGAIPTALRLAATALDQAERKTGAKRPSARIRFSSVTLKPAFVLERMTAIAIAAIDQRSELTERELLAAGFTEVQIRQHGAKAITASKAALPPRVLEAAA